MNMTEARRMALDNVGPIRMTLDHFQGDFQSCKQGWSEGQALCAFDLDLFFAVSEATVIEVIPKRLPGKNRVKIVPASSNHLRIDGELWSMYLRTARVANYWIHKGYNYVQIEIIK